MTPLAVRIGVPDEDAARELSRKLVEERVAAGTRTSSGPSHYRWEGEVHERTYWTVTAFTTAALLEPLQELVEATHPDDLPGMTYTEFDADDEYLAWIEAETG